MDHCARPPAFGALGGMMCYKRCKNRHAESVDHCAKGGQKVGAVVIVGAVVGRTSSRQ
jgi:hypothetical protein